MTLQTMAQEYASFVLYSVDCTSRVSYISFRELHNSTTDLGCGQGATKDIEVRAMIAEVAAQMEKFEFLLWT